MSSSAGTNPTNPTNKRNRQPRWPMWKHQFAAVGILLLCLGAWVGTALYRAHAAESAVRRRLDHMSERTRAGVTTPGLPEPDVRADRRALLLNPFLSKPPVYLYLNGRKVAELHL